MADNDLIAKLMNKVEESNTERSLLDRRNRADDIIKANPELIQELRKYFQPRSELVIDLPEPLSVVDMTEVILKDSDGNYVMYKMIEGNWIPFVQVNSGSV